MSAIRTAAAALMAGAALTAQAFPIAAPGSEGFVVYVASTGEVTARYEGNSADFSNDLYLENTGAFVFNNHASAVGSEVVLGSFAAGTELLFRLRVNDTGQDFFTGAASRNPDANPHARVQSDWEPGRALVSFEDLFNGPFDYNDLSFSFTNTAGAIDPPPIPEPGTYALMLAGLAATAFVARRRRKG
jgi:hypothetical protein